MSVVWSYFIFLSLFFVFTFTFYCTLNYKDWVKCGFTLFSSLCVTHTRSCHIHFLCLVFTFTFCCTLNCKDWVKCGFTLFSSLCVTHNRSSHCHLHFPFCFHFHFLLHFKLQTLGKVWIYFILLSVCHPHQVLSLSLSIFSPSLPRSAKSTW